MNMQNSILIHKDLVGEVYSSPLCQTLHKALLLARELGEKNFENWIRLELNGYIKDNIAMTDEIVVPEYRTVVGFYNDLYGRPLIIKEPKLHFVNEYRLRNGIEELEQMAVRPETYYVIQDLQIIEMIHEILNVNVNNFNFNEIEVVGVLSRIRSKLTDWLFDLQKTHPELAKKEDDKNTTITDNAQENKIQINIGNGTIISGSIVIAHSIANSFTKADKSDVSNNLKDLLKQLATEVAHMSEALPRETAEEVVRDLDIFTSEATSKTPRKKWWQLSAEGLKQAAKDIGEIGKPVLEIVSMIVTIMTSQKQ